jgi:hypothetical protein
VLVQVILRCQPRPEVAEWSVTDGDPFDVGRRTYRPSCITWDGNRTHLLAEGIAADVAQERRAAGTEAIAAGPAWPDGPHRGRISVRPGAVRELASALRDTGVRWLSEVGVGTVHVAAGTEEQLAAARAAAERQGGWLLREAGAPDLDGFGRGLPNRALMARIASAFDPTGKLGRGRLPLHAPAAADLDGVRARA